MHAPEDTRRQFAAPWPLQTRDAQLIEIVIQLLNYLLRVGDELALHFIHAEISLAQTCSWRRIHGCEASSFASITAWPSGDSSSRSRLMASRIPLMNCVA